ncbi:hypothetical protein ACUZ97_27215, partial [Klebsiella pneumoniae]
SVSVNNPFSAIACNISGMLLMLKPSVL